MARTFRRKNCRHDYSWLLPEGGIFSHNQRPSKTVARTQESKQKIARYHSDAFHTIHKAPPQWYRRIYKRRLDRHNQGELRKFLSDVNFDPVFVPNHRHSATWDWW